MRLENTSIPSLGSTSTSFSRRDRCPPLPLPHPHTGIVFDPFDYLPFLGSTIKVAGLHRALGGSVGVMVPMHIPIGGVFVKPPANDSEVLMGSSTVLGDGEVLTRLGMPMLSCSDLGLPPIPRLRKKPTRATLSLPTTFLMAIPSGVSVGGSPTITMMALAMRAGIAVLRQIAKKVRRMWKARKLRRQNGRAAHGLDPVDLITGAVFESTVDLQVGPIAWERHYSTERAHERSVLGHGCRHGFEYELRIHPQALEVRLPTGERILGDRNAEMRRDGICVRRLSSDRYELEHGALQIYFGRSNDGAWRVKSVDSDSQRIRFEYRRGVLFRLSASNVSLTLHYDHANRITGVNGRAADGSSYAVSYEYDSQGNLICASKPNGARTTYFWDDAHRWTEKVCPRGSRYSWEYDSKGRCIAGSGENGRWSGTISYREERRETILNQRGGQWIYRYNAELTITEIVDPMGGNRRRHVDDLGRVTEDIDCAGNSTRLLYDENGASTASVDALGYLHIEGNERAMDPLEQRIPDTPSEWISGVRFGAPIEPKLDSAGRVIALRSDPGERCIHRDIAGNIVGYEDLDGRRHSYEIEGSDLVCAEIDPLGNFTRYEYGASDQVVRIVDPQGTASAYVYDPKDRLTHVRRAGALRDEYVYNTADQLIEKRDGIGRTLLRMSYGDLGLVSSIFLESGEQYSYDYDPRGLITQASSAEHDVRLGYDAEGCRTEDRRDNEGVVHAYENGRRICSTLLNRFAIRHAHNEDAKRTVITDPTGREHMLRVVAPHRIERRHANGCSEQIDFDREGRCTRQTRSASPAIAYRLDREGNLLGAEEGKECAVSYEWDAAGRLVGVTRPDGHQRFEYDAAGNLFRKPGLANVRFGPGNQLQYANDEAFFHDHRQNVSRRVHPSGRSTHYVYDGFDQLVAIRDEQAWFWTATYDGLGRRISAGRGAAQRKFYWDGDRLAAEQMPSGAFRVYGYAAETALVPVFFVDYESASADPSTGSVYAVFTDQIGMPRQIEDANGKTVWQAKPVDAYGMLEIESQGFEFNLRWPGHYFDPETKLHYNRFRYYDPSLGRYLQSDPAGTAGGLNLYAYVSNPVSNVDVLGLSGCGEPANVSRTRLGARPLMEGVRKARSVLQSLLKRAHIGGRTGRASPLNPFARHDSCVGQICAILKTRANVRTGGGRVDVEDIYKVGHTNEAPRMPSVSKALDYIHAKTRYQFSSVPAMNFFDKTVATGDYVVFFGRDHIAYAKVAKLSGRSPRKVITYFDPDAGRAVADFSDARRRYGNSIQVYRLTQG